MIWVFLIGWLILGNKDLHSASIDGLSLRPLSSSCQERFPFLFKNMMKKDIVYLEQYHDMFSDEVWEIANLIASQISSQKPESSSERSPEKISKEEVDQSFSYLVVLKAQLNRSGVTPQVVQSFKRLLSTGRVLYITRDARFNKKLKASLELYLPQEGRMPGGNSGEEEEKPDQQVVCPIAVPIDQIVGALIKLDQADLPEVEHIIEQLLHKFGPALCYAGLFDISLLRLIPEALPLITRLQKDKKETITYEIGIVLSILQKVPVKERKGFIQRVLAEVDQKEESDIVSLADDIAVATYGTQKVLFSVPRGFSDMVNSLYLGPYKVYLEEKGIEDKFFLKSFLTQCDFMGSKLKTTWVGRQLVRLGYQRGHTSPQQAGFLFKDFFRKTIQQCSPGSDARYKEKADHLANLIEAQLSDSHSPLSLVISHLSIRRSVTFRAGEPDSRILSRHSSVNEEAIPTHS